MSSHYLRIFQQPKSAILLILGFASGLPLALTSGTLQAWMTVENIDLKTIGFFSLVGQAYVFKFLWSPVMDRYTPPFLGRRRGWLVMTQVLLLLAIAAMGFLEPTTQLRWMAALAVVIAFCSASQDIVFDAWKTDVLPAEERGAGAAISVLGYRLGMLVSGGLALWLAVTVAKGESVWGMGVKQGTTLYLCLEDSTLRIQNRLFEITEDAPASVHFSTNSDTLGKGLEEQLCSFLVEHPDTVLVIIDTLQMIRGTGYDNTYANDYRDLSVLKHIADTHGIAILLIHHLRKELADDVFSRISGTTAISGAVDSSFTLIEDKRGSGKATLSCIGRDIEYRELTLERNAENVWELVSDSRTQPELLGGRIVILLSELMRDRTEFIGTPTELSAQIDPAGSEGITPKKVSRLILQSVAALSKIGISAVVRRSNGKRLIELRRAESDDAQGV